MTPVTALLAVLGLVAVATAVGLVWTRRNGRIRPTAPDTRARVRPADLPSAPDFGTAATLLQFSTEFCTFCPATRRVLGRLAERHDGVVHVDVDLTDDAATAARFSVLQTPTTLLLDADGVVHARIGGAPRPAELEAALTRLLGGSHVAA